MLKSRHDSIAGIKTKAAEHLKEIAQNPERYKKFLEHSIAQSLIKIEEKTVLVQCRKQDVDLVSSLLPSALKLAQSHSSKSQNQTVALDKTTFLKSDDAGGVILTAMEGRIICDNTLNTRLNLAFDSMMPATRDTLFGANPNRKHIDR